MRFVQPKYFNIEHEQISQMIPGGADYVSTFCLEGETEPVAIYRPRDPELARQKGFDELIGFSVNEVSGYEYGIFRSFTTKDLHRDRFQEGVFCLTCGDVIYSITPKDSPTCGCGNCFVEGGKNNLSYGGPGFPRHAEIVFLDLLKPGVMIYASTTAH